MKHERHGAIEIFTPSGPLVGNAVETVGDTLRTAIGEGRSRLILDCAKVSLIDSRGLELLLDLSEACAARGGRFPLLHLSPLGIDVLRTTGLLDRFERYDNSTAALGSFVA